MDRESASTGGLAPGASFTAQAADLGLAGKLNGQNLLAQMGRKGHGDDLGILTDDPDKPYLAQIAALESGDSSF